MGDSPRGCDLYGFHSSNIKRAIVAFAIVADTEA